jgi:AraC-like DNA-binding protein
VKQERTAFAIRIPNFYVNFSKLLVYNLAMEYVPEVRSYSIQLDRYDPDRLSEAIAGGSFDHVLLQPGPCSFFLQHWNCGTFQVDCGSYSFSTLVRGGFPAGRICLGFVPRMHVPTWINGFEVHSRNLQVYSEDAELLYRAGGQATWCSVTIEREDLQRAAMEILGRPLSLSRSGVANMSPDAELLKVVDRMIVASLRRLKHHSEEAPEWKERLTAACVEALASADPEHGHTIQRRASHRHAVVKRADRILRASVGERYSSDQLCRLLGISERSLQLHFKQALGISPKSYSQQLALERAHSILRRRKPGRGIVTEVALECGFEHFGRFSQSYRSQFGETPSSTVWGQAS